MITETRIVLDINFFLLKHGLGLCGKVSVAGGAAGVASVKEAQELPHGRAEPAPGDLLLGRAGP